VCSSDLDMAKERLPKILEEQPDGPYILLGHCNGAVVGFEAARQLISMGKEVKAVVMIDPVIISVRKSAQFIFPTADFFMRLAGARESKRRESMIWIWRLLAFLDRRTKSIGHRVFFFFFKKTWSEKRALLKELLEFIGRHLHILKPQEPKERENIRQHYSKAFFKYKPLPLNVPVLYIALEYSGYAWRRVTRNTVYINIHGAQHNSWKEDYSQGVVDNIREFINC
jgi:oxalate---CoA ligase